MTSNIKSVYRKLSRDRIHQGDILENFEIPFIKEEASKELNVKTTKSPFSVILSQDCDLDGIGRLNNSMKMEDENQILNGNKFLPSILITPLYDAKKINKGTYLNHLGFKMDDKGGLNRTKWKNIKNNKDPRYHYLKLEDIRKELIADFKIFYIAPYDYIFSRYGKCYFTSLNELFREDLSTRFFNYQARIGLPPINENNIKNSKQGVKI
ncbi:MAG: hypothetical protein Q4P11_04755 [Methanobrevibacter sp.]|nr:hypothetical protein [Methanobrevibacter sp.]